MYNNEYDIEDIYGGVFLETTGHPFGLSPIRE